MTKTEAMKAAIKAAGSHRRLADGLGLKSVGTISGWLRRGYVPAERVLAIELMTGVSRHELRPDVYPKAEAA